MIRYIKARPRLTIAAIAGMMLLWFLPSHYNLTTRLLISWDAGTALYLIMVVRMISCSDIDKIRSRAAMEDEGRIATLILTSIAAITSLAAIVAELSNAKALAGALKIEHIALTLLTVLLSWTFMQTMYALHYAHEFYLEKDRRNAEGLLFPEKTHHPDYWDFIYYSFVIGTSAQTADVAITSGTMRKLTTVHCVLAFFFNATILALTVNIGAGLL